MQYDRESNISPESTSHTHACTSDDIKEMIELISTQNPFKHQPGRSLQSFPSISKSPLDQLDVFSLHAWLTHNKKQLAANPYSCDDQPIKVKRRKKRKLFSLMKTEDLMKTLAYYDSYPITTVIVNYLPCQMQGLYLRARLQFQ